MTVSNMWGAFVGPWGGGTLGTGTNYGMVFTPTVDGAITKVGFRRRGSGSAYLPNRLQLWRVNDQALLWETTTPTDSGALIWQMTTVAGGITAHANVAYVVTAYFDAGKETVEVSGGSVPAYGANLQKPTLFRRYISGGGAVFPTNNDASWGFGVDIEFDSEGVGAPDDTPVSGIDLDNALASWLDEDDAPTARPGSLPVLSHALLTDPAEGLAAIKAAADTAIAVVEAALGPGGDFVVGTVRTVLEAWHDVLVDALDNTPPTIMGPGNPTIADVMNAIAALPASGGGGFPLTVGDADWTGGTPSSHYGSKIIATDADAYVITITDIGDEGRTARDVDGTTVHWIRGWARVWDGSKHYNPHTDVLGPSTVVMSHSRMPGVMVYMPPDVGWDITPYDYTP